MEKEYKNSDILLYSVKNLKKIIAIYDNKEQMDKYMKTGDSKDAPVNVFNYSPEKEEELLKEMKTIDGYEIVKLSESNSKVIVTYSDGTTYPFAEDNIDTIRNIMNLQKSLTKKEIIGKWDELPEEEKVAKKENANKNWKNGLKATLAALLVAGGIYHGGKMIKASLTDTESPKESPTTSTEDFVGDETQISKAQIKKYSESLYEETMNKNSFLLTYQQVANVNMNEDLAYSIVEVINGIYPSRLESISEEQAKVEMTEIRAAIDLINAGNLNPATPADKMINLADFIENDTAKALANNSLMVAREVVSESIGEPLEGKIMEDYQSINVFSKKYINAVDQLINYEWETMNSAEFLQAPMGTRSVVTSIWQNIGAQIPQWSYTMREASEYEPREHALYYRYFIDESTNRPYYPRKSVSGECEYVLTYEDEKGCHEEVYTEAQMYAMAGEQYTTHSQNTGIEPNANIHQLGIAVEIDNRQLEQDEVLFNNNKNVVVVK